ncbi:MAG TPA: DinB family protein [Pirellulales bacterium]|nr:DinB family protein [Pirellulales bacterium]
MHRQLIERYAAEADDLGKSIAGLSQDDLNAFPVPGTWSIQQIVLHMLDSDLIAADRMKRVIAEDNPLLLGYDESKFAQRLHCDKLDPHLACEVFAKNRRLMAEILHRCSDADFQRTGIHSERGKITLLDLVNTYTQHLQHHLKFVREKRKLLGKPA